MPVPDFVVSLRERIGHDLLWLPGVTAVVLNGDHAQYLDHTFRCRYVAGVPHVADDESLEVRWFPTTALPPMKPTLRERILTAVAHVGPTRLA